MGCTTADIVLDMWAHRHTDDPTLRNEIENPDFEQDLADMEAEEGIPPEGEGDAPPDPGDFDDEVI